jgi:hypothetical protein
MVDIQIISSVLASFSVIFGVIAWLYQMRENRKINQASLFMQIFDRQFSKENRENLYYIDSMEYRDFDDAVDKYGIENNPDGYFRFSSMMTYYEGIGVLVKRNLVDPTMVDDLMSGPIIRHWEKVRDYVEENRRRTGYYEAGEHAEHLYHVIKGIRDKQREAAGLPT